MIDIILLQYQNYPKFQLLNKKIDGQGDIERVISGDIIVVSAGIGGVICT